MKEYLGKAVIDGVIQYFSVSALEKADPRSGGCARKYWYRYIGGIKEPETASKQAGTLLHDQLASYITTGNKAISALALSGLHMVPEPGPDVQANIYISPKSRLLTADGTPLVGEIDCLSTRGVNKGGEDISDIYDPPHTVEVIDWKWKRDGAKQEYFMQPTELVKSIQMSGYGIVASKLTGAQNIRLSHGYFPSTRGRPRKVTKLHVLDDCLRSWEYTDSLARTVKQVARETSPERVDGNVHSCDRYGGCPYREGCSAYKRQSLSSIFGETSAEELKVGLMNTIQPGGPITTGVVVPAQGSQQYQQAMAIAFPPAPATSSSPTVDMRAQLAAEEQAQRAQQAQIMTGSVAVPPGFAEAIATIQASGRGFPRLIGAAAAAAYAAGGQNVPPGTEYPGSGPMGNVVTFDNCDFVLQLAAELRAKAPAPTPVQHATVPISILPPDAPESNPALAAKPIEGYPTPGNPSVIWGAPAVTPQALAAQGWQAVATNTAGQPTAFVSQQPSQVALATAMAAAPQEPAKKTRAPRKSKVVEATPVAEPQLVPGESSPQEPAAQVAQVAGVAETLTLTALEVFVDCVPNGEYESLHPYIDRLCDVLCSRYIPANGLKDIRCAPKDTPLGFGGWRGGVSAIFREMPPPAGRYFLDTRGNEIAAEVADAMRLICEKQGGLFVRGLR